MMRRITNPDGSFTESPGVTVIRESLGGQVLGTTVNGPMTRTISVAPARPVAPAVDGVKLVNLSDRARQRML
jgi:hypothetical protein